MDPFKKKELYVYVLVWSLVFLLVPVTLGIEVLAGHDSHFHSDDLFALWLRILPFLGLFLLHNFAARWYSSRRLLYFAVLSVLLILFGWYCLSTGSRPPQSEGMPAGPPDGKRMMHPETMKIILGVLLVAANLGVKAHFEVRRKDERLHKVEAENLRRQLEALRYQINPHFLMNTLNNIQALVLVSPGKAMDSISILSKMMRTLLYEGSSLVIPLSVEIEFIRKYLSLVGLRYASDTGINTSFPESVGDETVPPLLLATIVENAFKHGTAGGDGPIVSISLGVSDGRIEFRCSNRTDGTKDAAGRQGIGLSNISGRLALYYGEDYSLNINEGPLNFELTLDIPSVVNTDEL